MAENNAETKIEQQQAIQPCVENGVNTTPDEKLSKYEMLLKATIEKNADLESQLKKKDEQINAFKTRAAQLEEELLEANKFKTQHAKDTELVAELKAKSDDTLTRAKAIIFEKTKVIKNQELQLDALNQQVTSLKDVVSITKDLLEIRNMEIRQLETKIEAIEGKMKAEKERQELLHKKLENMIRYNGELKREYETQLCLFSALRERYNEKELAKGVLKECVAATPPAVSVESLDNFVASLDQAAASSSLEAPVAIPSADSTSGEAAPTTPPISNDTAPSEPSSENTSQ